MKGILFVFLCGMVAGGIMLSIGQDFFGMGPAAFKAAATPAFEMTGATTATAEELSRALNPCIRPGSLPEGCADYIDNGQFLQPPIRIVIDDTRLSSR